MVHLEKSDTIHFSFLLFKIVKLANIVAGFESQSDNLLLFFRYCNIIKFHYFVQIINDNYLLAFMYIIKLISSIYSLVMSCSFLYKS